MAGGNNKAVSASVHFSDSLDNVPWLAWYYYEIIVNYIVLLNVFNAIFSHFYTGFSSNFDINALKVCDSLNESIDETILLWFSQCKTRHLFTQNEMKGERGESGLKGEKGELGGGFYDPRFGAVQGPPGNPGLPVRIIGYF